MLLDVSRKQFKLPSWVIPALGYLVSAGCLVWVLQGVDYATLIDDLRSLQWRWVIVGVIADIAVYIYQAWRWNLLLSPVAKPPLWRSVQAIYVGLFSNEVLPFRPGELIRSYLQSRWSKIPFSVSVSSALLERVFDGIWLIIVFVVITAQMANGGIAMPRVMIDIAKFLGVVVTAVALGLGLIMFWKQHAHRAIPATRWGQRVRVFIDDLHLMGQSRSIYWGALASLPYLLIQVIPIYALLRAYELELGIGPALVVLVIWRIGTAIPQAPGNVGASQALMVLALALFGVDKTTAAGLSVVIWGVITLPLLLAGFAALALSGVKLGDLRDRARKHAAAPVVVTPAK
ncbi:MAG: lysylphosphatidylglycerol synthase transmembrane domain-containing protein [Acidobacteriota bacterium]